MNITIASDTDAQIWDDIIINSNEGTLFHTWKWLKIIEKHISNKKFFRSYEGKLYPLIVWEGEEIIGIMPVFFHETVFIKMAASPPLSVEVPYLGPVMKQKIGIKSYKKQIVFYEFQKKIHDFLKNTLKANYIRINTSPGMVNPYPFMWSNYSIKPECNSVIDLRLGKKTIWENFSHNVRNSIKRANKNGIIVTTGLKDDVESIYNLLHERQRVYAQKAFILEIFENFAPENVKCYIAKKEGVPLTGLILICYKNKVTVWFGTPKHSIDGINPNNILIWESILWACSNNYHYFEMIGTSDKTTFPFKVQFCGEITPFYTMKWYSPINRFAECLYHNLFPRYK
jgi:lipid II:glycine glycyltransferase (peptidoglycan interpeptide bridge formation enzyme)